MSNQNENSAFFAGFLLVIFSHFPPGPFQQHEPGNLSECSTILLVSKTSNMSKLSWIRDTNRSEEYRESYSAPVPHSVPRSLSEEGLAEQCWELKLLWSTCISSSIFSCLSWLKGRQQHWCDVGNVCWEALAMPAWKADNEHSPRHSRLWLDPLKPWNTDMQTFPIFTASALPQGALYLWNLYSIFRAPFLNKVPTVV